MAGHPLNYAPSRPTTFGRRAIARLLFAAIPATLALGLSLFLPTLNRRTCNPSLRCDSNLRQLGQAFKLYANENRGHYPPHLFAAYKTQDLSADTAVCYRNHTNAPSGTPTSDWLAANADFFYLGAGLKFASSNSSTIANDPPADIVVAYERWTNHTTYTPVLFADGRVERITPTNFPAVISRSKMLRSEWEALTRPPTTLPTTRRSD